MHNIKEIRKNFDNFKKLLKSRNVEINLDEIITLDKENRESIFDNIISNDPLNFSAIKNYKKQINEAINKTNNNDAILSYSGYINKLKVVVVALDFAFIGGSMGSVVGEVISQSIEFADKNNQPLIIISASVLECKRVLLV